eukprot:TRINITY_DN13273_c0_g1_i2.p1 TRINITY_DN13273_c0_g1~~TRINITY_DN13273_c0_g1_i2.p1  ORF type:complete len:274 (-),score=52.86 TRINITY_DN13273_c0_g1_i2:65-886(-)
MSFYLTPGSSPIDWCEENYIFSPNIAEFINTVSNILFILMPPLLMHLHTSYVTHCGKGIHVIWLLLMVVGISSAYFHATLSLLGQLLDELAILWVIMACYWLWYPQSCLPQGYTNIPDGRTKFSNIIIVFTFLTTFLGFLQPVVNAFCLLLLGIPTVVLMVLMLKHEQCPRVNNLARRSVGLWGLAIIAWVNDRFFCPYWSSVGFPYLHGVWHITIFLASYSAIVIFAYFDVKNHMVDKHPTLRYFPMDRFEFGVPFVFVQNKIGGRKEERSA